MTATATDAHQAPQRQRIRPLLRELVAQLPVGERLPPERELAARWNVARMTLRACVDGLIADGVLERRPGSGTYVVPQPFVRALALTSFSHDMHDRGMVPGSTLLSFDVSSADATVAARLRIQPGDAVVRFTRLRLADAEPMALETVWIAQAVVPGLSAADLSESLYDVLARRYGITVGAAKVTITPVLPDETTRRMLDVGAAQACLRLSMVDLDARGRVVMLADCVYRGDTYQLRADVIGAAFAGAHAPESRADAAARE